MSMRQTLRSLLRAPGFTFTSVITIAIAIGAASAVFTICDAVLFRPLAFANAENVVRVIGTSTSNRRYDSISWPDFKDVADSGVFAHAAAYDEWNPTLTGAGDAEVLAGGAVDSAFFDVLGVQPERGRFFTRAEDKPGNDTNVVISHGLWQRTFGGAGNTVGKAISLDGRLLTIIGILPRTFESPYLSDDNRNIDIWTTIAPHPESVPRDGRAYTGIARLRDGVTFEQATARVVAIGQQLARAHPDTNDGLGMTLVPLERRITQDVRRPLTILLAAVLLLLLMACVNVANLLLARMSRRASESAIRAAIGATPWHLAQQIVAEVGVIAAAGAASGIALARLIVIGFLRAGGSAIPRAAGVSVDARVVVFVIAATFGTALVVGLVPVMRLVRGRLGLFRNTRAVTDSAADVRAQSTLVVVQVAVSVVLLTAAALVGHSLWNLLSSNAAFDYDAAVAFDVRAPRTVYRDEKEIAAFYGELLPRLRQLPGVQAAGATSILPLDGDFNCNGFSIDDGRPPFPPSSRDCAEARGVTPGYFDAVGLTILSGRAMTDADSASAPPVIVIDESFAAKYFPNKSPLGVRISTQDVTYTIVGVVRAARIMSLGEAPVPAMYIPHAQGQTRRSMAIVLRTDVALDSLTPSLKNTVASFSPDAPAGNVRPLRAVVGQSVARQRFQTLLLLAFGSAALLLATVGIGGVLAYSVSRREREIGIRMTLGATPREVARLVVANGLKLVILGTLAGALLSVASNRFLQSMLFGVGLADPLSLAFVAAVILSAAFLAASIPAWRAAKTDPITVMQSE